MSRREAVLRLQRAGAIAEIARVGHAQLGEDDAIEIRFADGPLFSISVKAMDATDLK